MSFLRLIPSPAKLLLLGLLSTSGSVAQIFVGSDNFDDNSLTIQNINNLNQAAGQWRASSPGTGGAFTEINQRIEYTNSTATGTNYGALTWVSPSYSINSAPSGLNLGIGGTGLSSGAPFSSSWTARVTLSNTTAPLNSGYTLTGMEIYTLPSSGNIDAYYGIYLSNDATYGNRLMVEWGLADGAGGYTRTPSFLNIGDNTDVTVRATFDGSSHVLSYDYSLNGSTFISTGVAYDLVGAQAMPTAPSNGGGMGLGLIGFSNLDAGAISAGQMTYDNFAVSAVPEPSTYAAIAGALMLGFTAWKRRRQQQA